VKDYFSASEIGQANYCPTKVGYIHQGIEVDDHASYKRKLAGTQAHNELNNAVLCEADKAGLFCRFFRWLLALFR